MEMTTSSSSMRSSIVDLAVVVGKLRLALARVVLLDDGEVCLDDVEHAPLVGEDVLEVGDRALERGELFLQLLHFEGSEALQAHFEDGVRLFVGELERLHQSLARDVLVRGLLDDGDHFVDVREREHEPRHDVRALLRLVEVEARAADDDLFLMLDIVMNAVLEAEHLRLAVHEREDDDAVGRLQLGMFVERVQHDLRVGVLAQFDDDAHAVAVGFLADVRNAFDAFVLDEVGYVLDEARLVDLVRDLARDDARARRVAGLVLLDLAARAQDIVAAPRVVGALDARPAHEDRARREIGGGNVRHQLVHRDIGIVDLRDDAAK